jgi:hypothetical protein
MSLQFDWRHCLDFFSARPVVIEPSQALMSSEGWLLPIRQFDERIGLTATFARVLKDPRDPDLSAHTLVSSGVRALASSQGAAVEFRPSDGAGRTVSERRRVGAAELPTTRGA